jgi:molybdopterin biosynthesis enzyme
MSPEPIQRISRLAALHEIEARIDATAGPVAPREIDIAEAAGCVLAADAAVDGPLPERAVALRDGWAVAAERVADAGSYASVPLVPAPVWVDSGEPLPAEADAVLAPDAVTLTGGMAEAFAAAAPGDDVLPAGADADATPLRRAGERVRASDGAALRAAGIERVAVRVPRIHLISTHPSIDPARDSVAPLIAQAIAVAGGEAPSAWARDAAELSTLLQREGFDAVITIGGTGSGAHDRTVQTFADVGRVDIHGMAIRPGETAALGAVGTRPALLLPGRLDAALAIWLVLGRRLLARLTGLATSEPLPTATLTRKVTSTIGMAEVVPVGAGEDGIAPLASGYFPLRSLTRAAGWILVPADSEGFPAGTTVELRPLP